MCGIAGAISLREDSKPDFDRVRSLTARIAHRGPDGDGFWASRDGRVVLGHRRLAVIDLVSGQQPMHSRDGRATIVFNGEIYNYRELRKELLRDGAGFSTDSDTEIILESIQRRGVESLSAFNGMFAFALWDEDRSTLVLARDRLGKKPLYYTTERGCLYFCSSLEALHATATSRWTFDLDAIESYLTLGYIPAPRTAYREASKLPAATYLTVAGGELHDSRFWDLATEPEPFTGSFESATDTLDEMLQQAVSIRLRSDVPLGVLLSGGVDSSLVTAIARRCAGTSIQTFSVGFHEAAYDESAIARDIARRLGTEHNEYRIHTETLERLPEHIRHFGEPFAQSSSLPLWSLAREARRHVTVALGGDGGDEGFAGYNWYRNAIRIARVRRSVPPALVSFVADVVGASRPIWGRHSEGTTRIQRAAEVLEDRGNSTRFARLRQLFGPTDRHRLTAGSLAATSAARSEQVAGDLRALYEACNGTDLRRMRYVDINTYLADCLLPKSDVSTMAHALELRAPLLDHAIVRFGLSLPDDMLLEGKGGKKLLRAVLARYLPSALFDRPKQGFTTPVADWLRTSHAATARSLARSERFAALGWFNPRFIDSLVNDHLAGHRDNGERLFALLVLDEWLKEQHDRAGPPYASTTPAQAANGGPPPPVSRPERAVGREGSGSPKLTHVLRHAQLGIGDIRGAASRRSLMILAYHGIRTDESPVRNWMLLPHAEFEKQVGDLRERYDILPLDDAVARLRAGTLERPTACITFDDGYESNLTLALPVLRAHEAPATVFLATRFISSTEVFWTTALDANFAAARTGRVDLTRFGLGEWPYDSAEQARSAGMAIKSLLKDLGVEQREEVLRCLHAQIPDPSPEYLAAFRFLDWDQVREIERTGLVSIGAHTVNHEIVARLPRELVAREIVDSVARVAAECVRPSRGFAYPNGRVNDFNSDMEETLESAGCEFALTTIAGFNSIASRPYALRRLSIGGNSDLAAFRRLMSKPRNAAVAVARLAFGR